jgi:hypothetical protein
VSTADPGYDAPVPGEPLLTRRGALRALGGLGIVFTTTLTGGCDVGSPLSATPSSSPTGPADLEPDVRTAAAALAAVDHALDAVLATVRVHPSLRAGTAGLVAMHRAHRQSLADAVPKNVRASVGPAYTVAGRGKVAVRRLQATEQGLVHTLNTLAVRAESGGFARLLASMGAATLQRLPEVAG